MRRKLERVYQFMVRLEGIEPPIWRRIQVPETYDFWELHVAIQDAMGWADCHLHEFLITNPVTGKQEEIGIPDEDGELEIIPGWRRKIASYFSQVNSLARYVYDFGDDWVHTLELEEILPRDGQVVYPVCVAGERSCPPEDCGGVEGYKDFLEIIMDPSHEQYEEMNVWAGGDFDPERFDPSRVVFEDPQERWKIAFEEE
jgi:hypothetical protein